MLAHLISASEKLCVEYRVLLERIRIVGSSVVQVGKVGFPHRLTKEDAMKWFQTKYDGVILSSKAK